MIEKDWNCICCFIAKKTVERLYLLNRSVALWPLFGQCPLKPLLS